MDNTLHLYSCSHCGVVSVGRGDRLDNESCEIVYRTGVDAHVCDGWLERTGARDLREMFRFVGAECEQEDV